MLWAPPLKFPEEVPKTLQTRTFSTGLLVKEAGEMQFPSTFCSGNGLRSVNPDHQNNQPITHNSLGIPQLLKNLLCSLWVSLFVVPVLGWDPVGSAFGWTFPCCIFLASISCLNFCCSCCCLSFLCCLESNAGSEQDKSTMSADDLTTETERVRQHAGFYKQQKQLVWFKLTFHCGATLAGCRICRACL